jgi:ACS family tartrate transporter-like MFS transporter
VADEAVRRSASRKAYLNVVVPLFVASIIAYVDRVNMAYATLTMNADFARSARPGRGPDGIRSGRG